MLDFDCLNEDLLSKFPGALCAREYFANVEGKQVPITAVVFPPEVMNDRIRCRYLVEGAGISVDDIMGGVDRMAAILHTLFAVRHVLESCGHEITWISRPRMYGLPKRMFHGLGEHFERHCEELIDAEHEAATRDIKAVKRLWGERPGQDYEDCEGFKTGARLS